MTQTKRAAVDQVPEVHPTHPDRSWGFLSRRRSGVGAKNSSLTNSRALGGGTPAQGIPSTPRLHQRRIPTRGWVPFTPERWSPFRLESALSLPRQPPTISPSDTEAQVWHPTPSRDPPRNEFSKFSDRELQNSRTPECHGRQQGSTPYAGVVGTLGQPLLVAVGTMKPEPPAHGDFHLQARTVATEVRQRYDPTPFHRHELVVA